MPCGSPGGTTGRTRPSGRWTPRGSRTKEFAMTTITDTNIDLREALYNDRRVGLLKEIQLPTEAITTLHGMVIDLDPHLLRPDNPLFCPDPDPRIFLEN